jgi:hypothetical protein
MLHQKMVPHVPFPWPPHKEELVKNFHFRDYETDEVVSEPLFLWWLEKQIPSYKLHWKDLTRDLWMARYDLHPNLFFRPWIPWACFYYWQACYKCVMKALKVEWVVLVSNLLLFLIINFLAFITRSATPIQLNYISLRIANSPNWSQLLNSSWLPWMLRVPITPILVWVFFIASSLQVQTSKLTSLNSPS